MNAFKKVRKWADEVGAVVEDWEFRKAITVKLSNGEKFYLEYCESTSRRVINRGRGMKWEGNPKGLYLTENNGYAFQQSSQDACIEIMSKKL